MGNRALIAHERPDGRYDCYRVQWDGDDLTRYRRQLVQSGIDGATPVETGLSEDDLHDLVDPLVHEALYLVERETTENATDSVRTYLVVALRVEDGLPGDRTSEGTAALVAPPSEDPDGQQTRSRVAGARAALARLVEDGAVTEEAASETLLDAVRSWAAETIVLD